MRRMAGQGLTLGEFLNACGYGREFQEDHLLPQAAAIWSCSIHEIRDYPAAAFIAFCDTHGLMSFSDRPRWRTVVGGSRAYVQAVARDFAGEIRIGCGVAAITRQGGQARVRDEAGAEEDFDHVVIAAHADQALALLADADEGETRLLGSFAYTRNIAVLHADPRMMPSRKNWWSSWNYLGHTGDHSEATVSYWMNRLQPLATDTDLFVTLNPPGRMALEGEISRQSFDHPLFDNAALAAQDQLWARQGARNTWFCGAHFGHGFHEDGIQSGLAAGGPIQVLTMPRVLGYGFNPITLYFVHDPAGALTCVVHEANNTIGGRVFYVLAARGGAPIVQRADKAMYVSPFMDMDYGYEFALAEPGEAFALGIHMKRGEELWLTAAFAGARRDFTDRELLAAWLTHPLLTFKVVAAIHWEALRLWLKGIKYRSPPGPAADSARYVGQPQDVG